jgi:mRNA interferase MazF
MSTTLSGINIEQKSVVLVLFPYSDFSDLKQRPALVISNNRFNQSNRDVICCLITSKPQNRLDDVEITNADLERGKILKPSKIRPCHLFTIEKTQIRKAVAKINDNKAQQVVTTIIRNVTIR